MTPDRWQQIDQLFHAALERPPEDRPAFLDTACAGDPDLRREVESLLRHEDSAEGFLERPALQHAAAQLAGDASITRPDPLIAGYEIIRLLGEGGMGVVYHAATDSSRFIAGSRSSSSSTAWTRAMSSLDSRSSGRPWR